MDFVFLPGLERSGLYIAEEVRDPKPSLRRSLLLGMSVVMALYMGLNIVFLYSVPIEDLDRKAEVGAIAAQVWAAIA